MVSVYTISSPVLPCSGWDIDPSCCTGWDDYTPTLQTAAAEYGAFTIWAATGRRFGLCTKTVRPCGMNRSNEGIAGYWWSDGAWRPYIFNGVWRNCAGCGTGPGCCSCEPACQVWLDGPVHSVSEVSVDGVVVDPDTYRVDDGQWLVRTRATDSGACWPSCQDYNLDTGEGVFTVTYRQGIEPPSVLKTAAGELACEWAKSCLGLPCRLPQRVTSLARQGVSISMVGVEDLLKHGLTGVATVDQLIRNFNPYGLASRMKIASPDDPSHRTVTWP